MRTLDQWVPTHILPIIFPLTHTTIRITSPDGQWFEMGKGMKGSCFFIEPFFYPAPLKTLGKDTGIVLVKKIVLSVAGAKNYSLVGIERIQQTP